MDDHSLWKRRAMAFAVRCHRHLWGKNNQDPLSFLYLKGISLDLARSLYLGWNKYGQDRPRSNWGLSGEGRFTLPPGIVFPRIIDRELLSLFIIPMENPDPVFMVPGSDPSPVILGPEKSPGRLRTRDLLKGLVLHQKHPDEGVRVSLN